MSFFFINCSSSEELKSISTQELKVLLEKEKVQLMDVRTPKEIEEGFIESAKFANFFEADFYEKASKQLDKNKPVYLYCRSGGRSVKASLILKEKGFKVVNVLGGYSQWEKEN
ncbi:rhodanese-like domain-containing protein [Polaribacter sp. IC073]|nr:rhodanese-like domain-containing protein [Polaribacter sp. IC073]